MFAKVFGQIFDSSIAEDYNCRRMFMDLLVLADSTGAVDMTIEAISRRTNVPEQEVVKYVKELCQPDTKSRSKLEEGKRLIPLDSNRDWGWQIVNYSHYRKLRDEAARREYFRDKQRESRKRKQRRVKDKVLTGVDEVGHVLTAPSPSSCTSDKSTKSTAVRTSVNGLIDSEWIASLKDDKTYADIDVDRELGRMHNWCKVRKVTATRRRFVNWLNRVDKPMSDQPILSPQHRQNRINFLNERKQKINRQIEDPRNPPSWAEKELADIDKQLQKL